MRKPPIGIHWQNTRANWPAATASMPIAKWVGDYQKLREVKAANPNALTIFRSHREDLYHYAFISGQPEYAAREYFAGFLDGTFWQGEHWRYIDVIEEFNEYTASSHSEEEKLIRIRWMEAVCAEWNRLKLAHPNELGAGRPGGPIRLCMVNAPIGNDIDWRYAAIAAREGHYLGYHPYILTNAGEPATDEWRWHSGRWSYNDAEFVARGIRVNWLFTEMGPYLDVVAGWRDARVCGGDIGLYTDILEYWLVRLINTVAYNEGRVGGGVLFTASNDATWWAYNLGDGEVAYLGSWVSSILIRDPIPPSPPTPTPEPREWDKRVILVNQQTTESQYDAAQALAFPTKTEIAFSADSAFARPDNVNGHEVIVIDVDGWGGQAALESWVNRYYLYDPPTRILYRDWPPPQIEYATIFDFPVGTPAERQVAVGGWPGSWVDANSFLNHYSLGYHTGSDLNLNVPSWNLDRGQPVYAMADGYVTYAQLVTNPAYLKWGRLVVIKHPQPDGSNIYTRYAHMQSISISAGVQVYRGQEIGVVGGVEYGVPDHLHVDISPTELLESDPINWPGETYSAVVANYVSPLPFILQRRA